MLIIFFLDSLSISLFSINYLLRFDKTLSEVRVIATITIYISMARVQVWQNCFAVRKRSLVIVGVIVRHRLVFVL